MHLVPDFASFVRVSVFLRQGRRKTMSIMAKLVCDSGVNNIFRYCFVSKESVDDNFGIELPLYPIYYTFGEDFFDSPKLVSGLSSKFNIDGIDSLNIAKIALVYVLQPTLQPVI